MVNRRLDGKLAAFNGRRSGVGRPPPGACDRGACLARNCSVRQRDYDEMELNGVIASVSHLAYHFGAIRRDRPLDPRPGRALTCGAGFLKTAQRAS